MNIEKTKQFICNIGRRMYDNGFVAANDGNITVKINDNAILVTPTGVSKGFMTPEMITQVDLLGNIIEGKYKPSSELKMHLKVYQKRKDINAVVHAHPPHATSFAIANKSLDKAIMPEVVVSLGKVPVAPYGTPSTMEMPNSLEPFLSDYNAVLLQNHGVLTWDVNLRQAYFKMETVNFYAKILMLTENIEGVKELSNENIKKLRKVFNLDSRGRI
ncbi:MAG: class II aldolase/adducin family protein [bacterium]